MWVALIVLKLLLNLVAEQTISRKLLIENSTINNTKGKAKHPINNYRQYSATSSNIINEENNVILLYSIRLYCY